MNVYENLKLLPEDIQGWNGNSTVFYDFINELRPNTIVEVGTWKGQSAINMAKIVKSLNLNTKIYCVDTWLGSIEFWTTHRNTPERDLLLKNGYPQIYYQFLSNVVHQKLEDVIIPFPNTSTAGAEYLKYFKISPELIYIDASHQELEVYNDIRVYYDILPIGGVIFGDDYVAWAGVKTSVQRFCSENGLNFQVLENNFWVIRK